MVSLQAFANSVSQETAFEHLGSKLALKKLIAAQNITVSFFPLFSACPEPVQKNIFGTCLYISCFQELTRAIWLWLGLRKF